MAQPFQEPTQEASEDTSVDTMKVFNHIVQTLLNINEAEVASLQNWIKYMAYNNFLDLCFDFQTEDIQSYSGYRVEGQQCTLTFGTMDKLRMFISWVGTKMKHTPVMFHYDNFLLLTHQEFLLFRQEEVSRMTTVPTV